MKFDQIGMCPYCLSHSLKVYLADDYSFSQVVCKCGVAGPIYKKTWDGVIPYAKRELAECAIQLWNCISRSKIFSPKNIKICYYM